MRLILLMVSLCCAACAGTAPVRVAETTTTPATVPAQPTVSDRNVARRADCRVIRALDGRAVCATHPAVRTPSHTAASQDAASSAASTPRGVYLVIGSFEDAANARRWAEFNDEFGTDIRVARLDTRDRDMHRVVVGPLDPDNAPLLREILSSAGVDESWRLGPCAPAQGASDAVGCSVLESPALAANTAGTAD